MTEQTQTPTAPGETPSGLSTFDHLIYERETLGKDMKLLEMNQSFIRMRRDMARKEDMSDLCDLYEAKLSAVDGKLKDTRARFNATVKNLDMFTRRAMNQARG